MTKKQLRKDCEFEYCPNWVPQNVKGAVWEHACRKGRSHGEYEVKWHYDNIMDIVRLFAPQ